jgi:hypothetical protein
LSACATIDATAPREPAAAAPQMASRPEEKPTITGSRIPARSTEKMVGRVTAQDYKESKEALPAPLVSN